MLRDTYCSGVPAHRTW